MKQLVTFCVVVCLYSGCAFAQAELPSNYEHIKCYDQLIGTWVYEGEAKETAEGIVDKGDKVLIRLRFRWILEKNAVETDFYGEVPDKGIKVSNRSMIGWDTAAGQIVEGGMNSVGGSNHAIIVYDPDKKTFTATNKGVDGKGEPVSGRSVVTVKDKDTIVMQAFDRKGGWFQGDGPAMTYKRVARAKSPRKRRPADQ
jgi:hypothetical protein